MLEMCAGIRLVSEGLAVLHFTGLSIVGLDTPLVSTP